MKPYQIYIMVPFSMTLMTSDPDLKVSPFWSRISEKRRIIKTKLLFHT